MSSAASELLPRCNETVCGDPSHDRVVALRLQGKRWSEIAAAVGITTVTLWRWRETCPHIDSRIATESAEYLEATKHALLALLPKAAEAMAIVVEQGNMGERMAAAKTLIDLFRKNKGDASDMQPAAIVARTRGVERLPDDVLDAELATVIGDRLRSTQRR